MLRAVSRVTSYMRSTTIAAPSPLAADVAGCTINVRTLAEAVGRLADSAAAGRGFLAVPVNLDVLVKMRRNARLAAACRSAEFVMADGAPVALLARRQVPGYERTTGADLLVPLAMECARRRIPIYLFGASDRALARAGADLSARARHTLDIAGTWAPSSQFDPEGPEADAAIARIRASGARVCFLALGAPLQEVFAARARAQGLEIGFVCVGAGIDFLAREQIRAPKFMQDWGLEWLWRLPRNPRRMTQRYASCALLLAQIALTSTRRRRTRNLTA